MFEALVFTIIDCGFSPRCAREVNDSGQVRIEKIYRIIQDCRLGIHDLSRVETSKRTGLPRFNMSFELGVFLGAKFFAHREKSCLILDKEPYRYQSFVSDIAGQDIAFHEGQIPKMMGEVRKWLNHFSNETLSGESMIIKRYTSFTDHLPALCQKSKLQVKEMTYKDFVRFVGFWVDHN